MFRIRLKSVTSTSKLSLMIFFYVSTKWIPVRGGAQRGWTDMSSPCSCPSQTGWGLMEVQWLKQQVLSDILLLSFESLIVLMIFTFSFWLHKGTSCRFLGFMKPFSKTIGYFLKMPKWRSKQVPENLMSGRYTVFWQWCFSMSQDGCGAVLVQWKNIVWKRRRNQSFWFQWVENLVRQGGHQQISCYHSVCSLSVHFLWWGLFKP